MTLTVLEAGGGVDEGSGEDGAAVGGGGEVLTLLAEDEAAGFDAEGVVVAEPVADHGADAGEGIVFGVAAAEEDRSSGQAECAGGGVAGGAAGDEDRGVAALDPPEEVVGAGVEAVAGREAFVAVHRTGAAAVAHALRADDGAVDGGGEGADGDVVAGPAAPGVDAGGLGDGGVGGERDRPFEDGGGGLVGRRRRRRGPRPIAGAGERRARPERQGQSVVPRVAHRIVLPDRWCVFPAGAPGARGRRRWKPWGWVRADARPGPPTLP